MAATNTIPAGKPPIDAAEDNISQFVDDVLANGAAAVADTFATRVRRELDSDRITFTLVFRLTDGTDVTFEVGMPNRSLAEVNYGARKVDKPWRFPRLHVTHNETVCRLWWRFAVQLATRVLAASQKDGGGDGGPRLGPAYDALSDQRSEGGLGWGYDRGLPDEPFTAAWGCRAIVTQGGLVDVLPDRQSWRGDDAAIDALLAKLNGGLNIKWKDETAGLFRGCDMSTGTAEEFTLLDEDGVVVKANTMGSGGYLYVCAYSPESA
jgi:hypothetical protein